MYRSWCLFNLTFKPALLQAYPGSWYLQNLNAHVEEDGETWVGKFDGGGRGPPTIRTDASDSFRQSQYNHKCHQNFPHSRYGQLRALQDERMNGSNSHVKRAQKLASSLYKKSGLADTRNLAKWSMQIQARIGLRIVEGLNGGLVQLGTANSPSRRRHTVQLTRRRRAG
ncbi:hypothetical protein BDP55DRAFT_34696 [Colletotrichum godetiae]|uniref:Uncharacterized protein n=1 Tax=Colletotrichum godetiae TaxID=1209918 RepID=A0AAJ0F0Z0_9PEZI|nr:uncharacterized protein BDP55DRAFT_69508 [Colletotrichum godetiae]XP_060432657.1 uncharacterized protein BDP55DRAFT_34696 [Colletotrichum godetiae]KAK1656741.1 hypothetical protein BDP55DRAFT_69508 [Colletotrichum godetiae]KAK1688962.1 hypothetical protein BDP55DRAFT_34696 [Colletotrichum godetiae]